MPLAISFELSDRDLEHFNQALAKARASAGSKSADEIIAAASKLLVEAGKVEVPDFIAERLDRLDALIAMSRDEGWHLPEEDRQRVLSALVYFADPSDVIPDNVPVLGQAIGRAPLGTTSGEYAGLGTPSVWRNARSRVDAMASNGMDEIEIPAFLRKQAD